MGSGKRASSRDPAISGLREKHQEDLEKLTLTSQPFKTFRFFVAAVFLYVRRSTSYLLANGGWLLLFSSIFVAFSALAMTVDGPHVKHLEEVSEYIRFGLWWIFLGVASSIGLGSGLHTFVLYLGPHIALFTIKAMTCGRVDLKSAIYDTIQLKRSPSWIDKPCDEFGSPVFSSGVPLSSILPQVQIEAIIWGLGTALGELPPYFISRAASLSGGKMEELETCSGEDNGFIAKRVNQIKGWLLSHSQYLNFFTILILASVPNPLFDLAGIMCGQFEKPFWEFFLATLIGKAIIKTHIQTVFIICVCNNQLLDWLENELIYILSFVPGFASASALPGLTAKLRLMKEYYLVASPPVTSDVNVKKWDLSFATVWNGVVWLMLLNFFGQIVTATAQRYLKQQQEQELDALTKKSSPVSKKSN
uniref:Vacuole membrane protein KMS2 n=1 Tax=Noccaea caerulescens TaxID=107243 RepID=A0A1J3IF48_NOCCA